MKKTLIRTVVITSLVTALAVSAIAYYTMPRLSSVQANSDPGITLPPQPVSQTPDNTRPVLIPRPSPAHRAANYDPDSAGYSDPGQNSSESDAYREPVVHHHRSTEDSVAIVGGSAGAGAAIGAIAGGGKGAAIGALSGGAAGFIFDRLTANK